MTLRDRILDPSAPVRLFELVPPASAKARAIERTIADVSSAQHLADAINLPEIHDESRGGAPRTAKFVPRVEPRVLGGRIRRELEIEVIVNRCVVYELDQLRWFRETRDEFGIQNVVLVGGESSQIRYPGPSVLETAEQARAAELPTCLGGITIPSRLGEGERIRRKQTAGLDFFTTQVLFDSNDIVWLIQQLNGVEARVFLSFAPVTHSKDLQFLRWLGADIPQHLDRFLLRGEGADSSAASNRAPEPTDASDLCFERSLDLARRILMDVFDNLPPDPPPIGLNVEHINQRNFQPALEMLKELGDLYSNLVAAHARVPVTDSMRTGLQDGE
jgi:5,10-methylenetetrahydrofolate reductase